MNCEAAVSTPDFSDLEPEFGDVMAILRSGPLEAPTERPSDDVWNAIAGQLGGDVRPVAVTPEGPAIESPEDQVQDRVDNVRSLDAHRSRGRRFAVLTAVAAAIALVAIPLALALGDDGPARRAELLALSGFQGGGRAELDGRTLTLDLEGLDAPEGAFYEVWLLDLEGEELVDLRSLGRVGPDGSYVVPADLDITEFSVVDVSIEPDDGNPDHSGDSVLRGGLEEA